MSKINEAYVAKIDRRWDIINNNKDSNKIEGFNYIDSTGKALNSVQDFAASPDFIVVGGDSGLLYTGSNKWEIQFYEKD